MTRPDRSLDAAYFDRLYAETDDPWSFATSPYERDKYDATLAALPRLSYQAGLEIGCSIGVLTHRLALRCADLLAVDISMAALERAKERNADRPQARFACMNLPAELPEGRFDLIMLSEVVYYWSRADVAHVAGFVGRALEPGGTVVLVHWLGPTDYPLTGDEAVEAFIADTAGFLAPTRQERTEQYRLDLLVRTG